MHKEIIVRSKFLWIVILVCLVANMVACGAPVPKPTVSPLSPMPTPAAVPINSSSPVPVATSMPGLGTVTGRLVAQETKSPLMNKTVYLARITDASDTKFSVAALDKSSPAFVTNGDGSFAFLDVPPGRYGLIMEGLIETVLLADLKTGKDIAVAIDADKTLDLGTIEVLPGY